MKILLSGGGTLGPVAPLLAIYEVYKKHNPKCKFIWVGTKLGPEREIVEQYNLPYFTIICGKWRRYFSFQNFIDVFKFIVGVFQSLIILWHEKPNLLISAGGFVSVPLHLSAALLGIPCWVHQQDARVGLANKIMGLTAKVITTSLRDSAKKFNSKKTKWIGNPVRDLSVKDALQSRKNLNLDEKAPVILAMGGGTGSNKINKLVVESLPHLDRKWQVVHLTGLNRPDEQALGAQKTFLNYHPHKFFSSEMKDAYAVADVVIGRGGFVTISELAALAKPAILLPMSGTHQEENVRMLAKARAAIILDERKVNGLDLAHIIREVLNNKEMSSYLGGRLRKILPPALEKDIVEAVKKAIK
ncbi:MAG: UDP-N-acetylglucosamine--N-acetylmuramyl-(pentapeptide) pyrophosphoryl-undecaprenol N-acetylglucosamine transferase [bacterium]